MRCRKSRARPLLYGVRSVVRPYLSSLRCRGAGAGSLLQRLRLAARAGRGACGGRGRGRSEERRTVTVLFADLSGYTSVAERLDHETVKTLIERCLTRFAAEVERFGGRVDKYIGDNVMAVFGAPVAHEDDAERAVRAAFGMQSRDGGAQPRSRIRIRLELALCVGVNTGEVLAGRIGDAYTVMGDAVNVAARLQAAAAAGGILVGRAHTALERPRRRLPRARSRWR